MKKIGIIYSYALSLLHGIDKMRTFFMNNYSQRSEDIIKFRFAFPYT